MVGRPLKQISFILLSALWAYSAIAADYVLFYKNDRGIIDAADDYDAVVEKLASGDTITFSDGQKFTIDKKLGNGATTQILSVKERPGEALRIPKKFYLSEYINHIPEGYRSLYERGIPIVGVGDHLSNEFVFVDRLPEKVYSFNDFARNENIPPELHEKMRAAFRRFIIGAASFSSIGDFGGGQIKYDPASDRWILHDWLKGHAEGIYLDKQKQLSIRKSRLLSSFYEKLRILMKNKDFTEAYKGYQWLFDYFDELELEIKAEQERLLAKAKVMNGKIDYQVFNIKKLPQADNCRFAYSAYSVIAEAKAEFHSLEIIIRTKP